jgi:sterol desaturase/sphingolipid hydroxylase (fatty acid hydroxylase superfamily)
MDILALAVPFFLLALLIELAIDRLRGTGHYRLNDAVNSLSLGMFMSTSGYFTKLIPALILAYVLRDFAIFDVQLAWFDASPGGLGLWLLAALGYDFCYYWSHRFGHEMSVLWAQHAVHHQSEDYNLSTALRQTSSGFLFTWIFYVPLFVLGMPFEVYVTVSAVSLIYQFWVHTQQIQKLGWFDRVFVSPSNHRVHHAQNEIYIDKNYGGTLILWDRLFGTFQPELDEEPVVFGVRKPLASWNPFWANLQVYSYLWFDAVRTRRWRDKLGIWFRRTGWRPTDVAARFPKKPADLMHFHKFDPPVTPAIKRYILAQFMLAVIGILWIGVLYATEGVQAVVVPCLLLWITLYSLGTLSETRSYALRVEQIRLFVAVPGAVLLLLQMSIIDVALADRVWAVVAAYLLLSLAAIRRASKSDTVTI